MNSSGSSSGIIGYLTRIAPKDVCDYDKGWERAHLLNRACRTCCALPRDLRIRGLDICVDHTPGRGALNCAGPPFVNIARKDFMDLLHPEAKEVFNFGRVLDSKSNPMERYVTYLSEKPVAVRGRPYEKSSFCSECGRFQYFPIPPPEGEQYVVADALPEGAIFESNLGDLLLRDRLASRLKRRKWPGIYIAKMPVRSAPIDGLAPFPEKYV